MAYRRPRIETSKYVIDFDNPLGEGEWGVIYPAIDPNKPGKEFAIKIFAPTRLARAQMRERGLTLDDVVIHEDRQGKSLENVVPGIIERDDKGRPFFVMPFFDEDPITYSERVGDRLKLGDGTKDELDIMEALIHIATGAREIHTKLGRTHGDISLYNVVTHQGVEYLTDLSSSTVLSVEEFSRYPRHKIGRLLTRAPELFVENSHPTVQSDIWSIGAIGLRLYDGRYPYEELLKDENPDERIKNLTKRRYNYLVNKKAKSIDDRIVRMIIRKALAFKPEDRHQSAVEMEIQLRLYLKYHEKRLEKQREKESRRLRKWSKTHKLSKEEVRQITELGEKMLEEDMKENAKYRIFQRDEPELD